MFQVWHSSLDELFPLQAHSSDVQPHSPKNNLENYNFNIIICTHLRFFHTHKGQGVVHKLRLQEEVVSKKCQLL